MLNDKEIESAKADELSMNKSIENFKKKYIEKNEFEGTLLLNGKWGIGKTSFLNSVEYKTRPHKDIKFVKINFWLEDWDAKPSELIVRSLWRRLFWIIKYLPIIITFILAVITSIIQSFPNISSSTAIWFALIIMISISTIIVDKYSSEALFKWILSKYLKCSKRKKIIFVFDDFDRIDKEKRTMLHSTLFNFSLYENVVLIIVGEYSKIIEKENDSLFIQKIIGTIVNMPLENMSGNVWEYFEKSLKNISSNKADISDRDRKINTFVRDAFIAEKRTMREAKQLLNSIQTQYFDFNTSKINFGEKLAICYIFQFHNKLYEWIIDNQETIYYGKLIPYDGYGSIKSKNKLIMSDVVSDALEIKIETSLSILIYEVFKDEKDLKYNYPSISDPRYFPLYQVQNTNLGIVLSIVDVDEIFIEKESNINCFNELVTNNQINQFVSLFENNYLDYNIQDEKLLKPFTLLLRTLTMLIISNSHNESDYTYSNASSLFYKVRDKLVNIYKQKLTNLFNNQIFCLPEIDVSEKLFVLPMFISASSDEQTQQQRNIVINLFKENNEMDILKQKIPRFCFISYYHYYASFPSELKIKVDMIFEKIFDLNNDEFYNFIFENLYSKNHINDVYQLDDIFYNEIFKEKFENKVNELDGEQQRILKGN